MVQLLLWTGEKVVPTEKDSCVKMDLLFELLKKMIYIAAVEDEIAIRYAQDRRKLYTAIHLYSGQEAVAAGVCNNLNANDTIFSNHRGHGHYLAKGGNLEAMLAELYGSKAGCCKGKGGSMHLCDMKAGVAPSSGIVAGNVSIATGYALANKIKGNRNLVCVFLGDGATEEGSVYESICYSKVRNIPILYIVENNLYAIHTPLKIREPFEHVSKKFSVIIPTKVVDGNNVEEVNQAAAEAVRNIRNGGSPFMLECVTYRTRAHHGAGDGIGVTRTQEEWDMWRERNPINLAKEKLIQYDKGYSVRIKDYEKTLSMYLQEAFNFAENSLLPPSEELLAGV